MALACPYCGAEMQWMTPAQVGRLLGVSDSRVRQMVRAGRFPGTTRSEGIHKNGMWRIPVSAVLPLVDQYDRVAR